MNRALVSLLCLLSFETAWADHVAGVDLIVHEHDHAFESDLAEGRGSWRLFGYSRSVVAGREVRDSFSTTAYGNWSEESGPVHFVPQLEVASYPCTLQFDLTF